MLEWAQASRHGGLAVLVDHDDAEREFAYESMAVTFAEDEPITAVGRAARLGRRQHEGRLGHGLPTHLIASVSPHKSPGTCAVTQSGAGR